MTKRNKVRESAELATQPKRRRGSTGISTRAPWVGWKPEYNWHPVLPTTSRRYIHVKQPCNARHDTRHTTTYDTSINQAVSSTASRTNNEPEARGQAHEGIDAVVARLDIAHAATLEDVELLC